MIHVEKQDIIVVYNENFKVTASQSSAASYAVNNLDDKNILSSDEYKELDKEIIEELKFQGVSWIWTSDETTFVSKSIINIEDWESGYEGIHPEIYYEPDSETEFYNPHFVNVEKRKT